MTLITTIGKREREPAFFHLLDLFFRKHRVGAKTGSTPVATVGTNTGVFAFSLNHERFTVGASAAHFPTPFGA